MGVGCAIRIQYTTFISRISRGELKDVYQNTRFLILSSVMERWTFLTNHSHVLVCIARDPEIRLRDVAVLVGITERAAQRIVADLIEGGYLSTTKVGRRNRYEVHADLPFRHPIESHSSIRALLELIAEPHPVRNGQEETAESRHLPTSSGNQNQSHP